jgi:hypothetical protein
MRDEWNAGYEKGRDDYCCNHDCNQGRDCPLSKSKPVAWWDGNLRNTIGISKVKECSDWQPLYTHPASLTEDELAVLISSVPIRPLYEDLVLFARAILRKAQEK